MYITNMIDATDVIKYDRTIYELEEFMLFCALVAGHDAKSTAKSLERILDRAPRFPSPFDKIRYHIEQGEIQETLRDNGIGCYTNKNRMLAGLVYADIDLRTCSAEDLESIYGIGPKTARYFIMDTRPDVKMAALDTHILAYLRELGYSTPKSTPTGKRYMILEQIFLKEAAKSGMTPAEFDLFIWNSRSRNGKP
jgi:thermostable 8-oxoguanine DNA glycosylase